MDETGVQLEHKPRRVLAQRAAKCHQRRTSGNRETVTVIAFERTLKLLVDDKVLLHYVIQQNHENIMLYHGSAAEDVEEIKKNSDNHQI